MSEADYKGRCHCGAIGFSYRIEVTPDSWSVRACQCSFCRAHDVLSTSDPSATIKFTAIETKALQKYRFGLRTADFLLCRKCGVYIGAIIDTDVGSFGIINVHALTRVPERIATSEAADYDSEDSQGRIERRKRRWSPASLIGSG